VASKNKNKFLIWAPCDLQEKSFSCQFGAIIFNSKHVGRHFCSDFQGLLEDSHRFFPDLRILPRFSPNQNFWGCVCTHGCYTSVRDYHWW